MKYKIDWIERDSYGNLKASVTREDGSKELNINLGKEFNDKGIMAGHEVYAKEWKSPKNGKLYLFEEKVPTEGRTAHPGANSAFKTKLIEEAQQNKAKNIAEAQDRSAWMWAKNNASMLLQTRVNGLTEDQIANKVLDLATKIYNGEPTEPFND